MRLRAVNFGPIEDVNLEISPLTVIIGKNNMGKSYLAQLYYTLLDTTKRAFMGEFDFQRSRYRFAKQIRYRRDSYEYLHYQSMNIKDIQPTIRAIKNETPESEIIQIALGRVLNNLALEISDVLSLSLEKSFGVKVGKLVKINSNEALIEWDLFEHLSLLVRISKRGNLKVELQLSQSGLASVEAINKDLLDLVKKIKLSRKNKLVLFSQLYYCIAERVAVFKKDNNGPTGWAEVISRPTSYYYIPAGRGGLLESYETVVSGLISISPLAPVRGLSMPPLPGMAAQFYSVLLKLNGQKGPMSRIITNDFKELLEGDVHLKRIKGQAKFRLIYNFSAGTESASTDVIHTASMIKELSPIYLIIQELVRPGDFLLIEEPESHLHPGAQIKLVNIIGTLVNNGVNTFFTTHSDLLLRAVGHLSGRTSNKESAVPIVSRDKIVIYWLKNGKDGCISEKIELTARGILPEIPTFDKVVDDLYETELELEENSKSKSKRSK